MSNTDVIWTCSKCFLYCLWPNSTSARSSKSIDIGYDCIKNSIAKNVCSRGACGTDTCIGSPCGDSVSVVKRSGMHSQLFQNLEIGGTKLEIQVEASYAFIKSACFCQNIEVGSTGLEIQVGASLQNEVTEACCIYEPCKGGC